MTSTSRVVGVLGGMGPLATIDFMRKMLDATEAFRGEGDSPLEAMIASARRLQAAGAGLVVVACNTAHLWYDDLAQAIGLPMIHLVDAAIEDAARLAGPGGRLGLLGTDATLASGLYVNRASVPPVQWLQPTAGEMLALVMPAIAAVKAGDLAAAEPLLLQAAQALRQRGATALVLGCTEIPLALHAGNAPLPVVDATAALARRAVAWSRRPS